VEPGNVPQGRLRRPARDPHLRRQGARVAVDRVPQPQVDGNARPRDGRGEAAGHGRRHDDRHRLVLRRADCFPRRRLRQSRPDRLPGRSRRGFAEAGRPPRQAGRPRRRGPDAQRLFGRGDGAIPRTVRQGIRPVQGRPPAGDVSRLLRVRRQLGRRTAQGIRDPARLSPRIAPVRTGRQGPGRRGRPRQDRLQRDPLRHAPGVHRAVGRLGPSPRLPDPRPGPRLAVELVGHVRGVRHPRDRDVPQRSGHPVQQVRVVGRPRGGQTAGRRRDGHLDGRALHRNARRNEGPGRPAVRLGRQPRDLPRHVLQPARRPLARLALLRTGPFTTCGINGRR